MMLGNISGIFWDYENVPLRYDDWETFIQGLNNYIRRNKVQFFKVYYRQSILGKHDEEILDELEGLKHKIVTNKGKNSVDNSMMSSCHDVLTRHHPDINHIILITGDADFLQLILKTDNKIRISIICQKGNFNENLKEWVDDIYFVKDVSTDPTNWWLVHKGEFH